MKFRGIFSGSGAARYIGLGFIPKKVTIQNIQAADIALIEWDEKFAAYSTMSEGKQTFINGTSVDIGLLTVGTGIIPYDGGDVVTSAAATHIIPVNDVQDQDTIGDMRDKGANGTITKFTLDTAANRTGHFDHAVDTDVVGVGSRVRIAHLNGQIEDYYIQAITNDGDAADEITLDRLPVTGQCDYISYKHDFISAPAGSEMPAGIYLAETAKTNVSGELCLICAE